jgi:hypothetical protein
MGRYPHEAALLWAIFLAEGACRASVPFGWLPMAKAWREGAVSFPTILRAVRAELSLEWDKYRAALPPGWDFVRWLARRGYNANPAEWTAWEKNVRYWLRELSGSAKIE